jgi:Zn-dependent protease
VAVVNPNTVIILAMDDLTLIQRIVVWTVPVLFAITVHEVAHGWVARRLGDPTAMMLGRLTLNPIKHIDPLGTVILPLLLLLSGSGFIFGWAKPVPVTVENLRNPKRDMAIVAAAGPASNLLMACLWAVLLKVGVALTGTFDAVAVPLTYMSLAGIAINVILMVLNLLPMPPLDGGRVLAGFLPGPWAWKLGRIEPYGFIILLVLLVSGVLSKIIGHPVSLVQSLLFSLAGL